jgi:hypothetical protein
MSAGKNNRKGSGGFSHGFVRMPRKAGRRRKKRGGASFFILLLLVLLIAGFLARRVMQPRTPHYVAQIGSGYPAGRIAPGVPPAAIAQGRGSAGPAIAPHGGQNPPANAGPANGENLTPEDHRALDDLIREKSR